MPDLYFHHVYDATASAESTVTVLGETAGDAVSFDQEIVVQVPVSALKAALSFDSSWDVPANNVLDGETLPTVTWAPRALELAMKETATKTAEDRFLAKYTDEGVTATFTDDAGDEKNAMQKVISQCSPASGSLIEQIPYEAIIKVTANGVVSDLLADILPASDTTSTHNDDRMNLFEQALAAGKASESTSGATGNGVLDFKDDDSITVYVKYVLHKKTTVELDTQLATGASKTFTLPDGTSILDGREETGPNRNYTVAWKFVAATF